MNLGLGLSLGSNASPLLQESVSFDDYGTVFSYYNANNLATLFQDTAGTTPVISNGDLIKRWNPEEGDSGLYLSEATNAGDLQEISTGKKSWFGSTGELLACADADGFDFLHNGTTSWTAFFNLKLGILSSGTRAYFSTGGSTLLATTSSVFFYLTVGASTIVAKNAIARNSGSNYKYLLNTGTALPLNTEFVYAVRFDVVNEILSAWINGSLDGSDTELVPQPHSASNSTTPATLYGSNKNSTHVGGILIYNSLVSNEDMPTVSSMLLPS